MYLTPDFGGCQGVGAAVFGAIEGGGTKFICALASAPDPAAIVETVRFETTDAAATLRRAADFFRGRTLRALGVASFGPIELDRRSARYGHVLPTPKPGWSNEPVLPRLADALDLPLERLRWDTDVNAAALGESLWGAGRGADPLVYVTVGTGIGGGVLVAGEPLHGLLHPEIGHVPVPPVALADGRLDPFPGVCPFHGRCWEGMATGPALAGRAGRPGESLPDDDPVWEIEAQYLALGLATCTLVVSPGRIVVGGGVVESRAGWLLPMVRRQLVAYLNGYVGRPELGGRVDTYVVAPGLSEPSSAIAGALALAGRAATQSAGASAKEPSP
jgi:fructokinase